MARAGYCDICNRYVYLNEQWGCQNGHPWTAIRAWYDPETGLPITPYWLEPGYAPAPQAETATAAEPAAVAAAPVAVGQGLPEPEAAAPAPEPEPPAAALEPELPAAEPEPPAPEPEPAAAPSALPSSRLDVLAAILAKMAEYPGYNAHYGTDTDIVIDNEVATSTWPGGKRTIEYSARMKAVEAERIIYFWELLTEKGGGIDFGQASAETFTISGSKRSGKTKLTIVGPDGVAFEAEWDYGATRQIVEAVAAQHGWTVKTVLRKASATW